MLDLLNYAREQHFLGPGEVSAHWEHSVAFAAVVTVAPDLAVDLGSGAGVPGLILALVWPMSRWVLVDANARRTAFLNEAVASLNLEDRVTVVVSRAELLGRDPRWRAQADLVVARGFGPPAVTTECAAPFLRLNGVLIVAEPPGGAPDRWPESGLELLGLVTDGQVSEPVALQRLRQVTLCPERYPRRVGIPLKRPLF